VTPALLVVAAYLVGSFPSSYLAGKWTRGIDLRNFGSGNLGATNTFRVLGPRIAAPVMVMDVLKGFLPAAIFPQLDGRVSGLWALAYGAAAIMGHVFSVYMRFRGGKGVATAAGVFLALAPEAVIPAIAVWLVVLGLWRMVSLASVSAALTLIIALLALEPRPAVRLLGVAVATFVVFAHRSNLRRIARGEEYRFGQARPAADPIRAKEGR
jgi:glycerol-3-phosphate acyltransferase PlsY